MQNKQTKDVLHKMKNLVKGNTFKPLTKVTRNKPEGSMSLEILEEA